MPCLPADVPLLRMLIEDRLRFDVLLADTPSPVVFWIVPPDPAAPVPVTVRPPLVPVALSTIPLVGPPPAVPAEILWNLSPAAPMVVFETVSALAVDVLRVLPASVAVTVPPPVAVKAGFAP